MGRSLNFSCESFKDSENLHKTLNERANLAIFLPKILKHLLFKIMFYIYCYLHLCFLLHLALLQLLLDQLADLFFHYLLI